MANQGNDTAKTWKDRVRESLPVIGVSIGYMIPVLWLWNRTGYPDDLGIHITAHGKAGILENWWYSYLLVERGHVWDIITFIYMWLGPTAIVGWLIHAFLQDRRNAHLSRSLIEESDPQ